jgi:hypothetical protein
LNQVTYSNAPNAVMRNYGSRRPRIPSFADIQAHSKLSDIDVCLQSRWKSSSSPTCGVGQPDQDIARSPYPQLDRQVLTSSSLVRMKMRSNNFVVAEQRVRLDYRDTKHWCLPSSRLCLACLTHFESVDLSTSNSTFQVAGKATTCCPVAFGRSADRDEKTRA